MIYLHNAPFGKKLIRHWANESESAEDTSATYQIRQIETSAVYDETMDVLPCRYTYEVTDIPISENTEETESQDCENALELFDQYKTET